MPSSRRHSLAALLSITPVLSCSVMGLDDFGAVPCTKDLDCERAAPSLRPAGACGNAICQKDGRCEWQEAHEICNGQDDDCDGLIDNGLASPVTNSAPAQVEAAGLAHAFSADFARTYVAAPEQERVSERQGWVLGSGGVEKKDTFSFSSSAGVDCPTSAASANGSSAGCKFVELALAADADHLVFAGVNTLGCPAGQLRVGLADLESTPFSVWFGKAESERSEDESNVAFGVHLSQSLATRGCTSAADVAIAPGATRPTVASLNTRANGEGALLLWLAAATDMPYGASLAASGSADLDSFPVEALGLIVPASGDVWLDGTDGGVPAELGRSTSRSPPAVLALPGPKKYLVAFPSAKGSLRGIRLLSMRVSTERAQGQLAADGEPVFLPVGAAEEVSLTMGTAGSDNVGLAWRAGSGSDAQLCFTIVSSSGELQSQPVLEFPAPNPLFAPQIMHSDSGFAEQTGNDKQTGGWFLSWVDGAANNRQTMQVARVRDGTFQVLTQGAVATGDIAQPVLFPSAIEGLPSPGYALIQPAASVPAEGDGTINWCQ